MARRDRYELRTGGVAGEKEGGRALSFRIIPLLRSGILGGERVHGQSGPSGYGAIGIRLPGGSGDGGMRLRRGHGRDHGLGIEVGKECSWYIYAGNV